MTQASGLDAIERALDALAFDGLAANLEGIVRIAPPSSEGLREQLALLEASSAGGEPSRRLALMGKTLSALGRHGQALEALDQAVAARPPAARTLVWRAQTLLMSGRAADALIDLQAALEADPENRWAYFFRAQARFLSGDEAGADADLSRLLESASAPGEAFAAGLAFKGLRECGAGRWDSALRSLDALVSLYPKAAWAHALRAQAHKGAGDFAACRRDLDAALALGPAPWIYLERSRLCEELGGIALALEDAEAAIACAGTASADLLARRAHLQECRRHYHLAEQDWSAALALEPDRPDLLMARARVHGIEGRLEGARADCERAAAVTGDPAVRLQALHWAILEGRDVSEALQSDVPRLRGALAFERGCALLKARRYAEAARSFGDAARQPEQEAHAGPAVLYRSLALVLEGSAAEAAAPSDRARLTIVGMGWRPPYSATADGLRALAACDIVFNNLNEPQAADLLHLLSPACRPTRYDIQGGGAQWTRAVFSEVRPGRTVGFATRGHPLVCGGLAFDLMAECRRQDVDWRVFNAVSSMDVASVRAWQPERGLLLGEQVYYYFSLLREPLRLDTRIPAVVYFDASIFELPRKTFAAFCAVLEGRYGPSHRAALYGRRFDVPAADIALSALRERYGKIDPSFTLVLPALTAEARA